jgi:hypothetical protein
MGSSAKTEYCAFTKAVKHLGDRWSGVPLVGDPRLVSQLPGRFLLVARDKYAGPDLSPRGPGLAVSGTG